MQIRTLRLTLSLLISAGIITACSQQTPNLSGNQNINTGANSNNTAGSQINSSETQEILTNNQDDETTIRDSEAVTEDETGFGVKSLGIKDNGNGKSNKELKKELKEIKKETKENIKAREKVLMDRIKLLNEKLKLVKKIEKNKLSRLERKNIEVNTSNVVEIINNDGTKTKIIVIQFQNPNDITFRETKVSKTFDITGRLIKVEYLVTIRNNQYSRTYLKLVDFNADGSKNVSVKSDTIWPNGKTRNVNEVRSIDVNGNGSGSGTVVIVNPNGQTTTFNFSYTISNNIIVPSPVPTPFPTISPFPTATPTINPTPTATPTITPSPTQITLKGFLAGRISIGPLCPVEPCNLTNEQIQAIFNSRIIQVYNQNRTLVVAQFQGDINGNYQIELPTGTYIVDTVHSGIGGSNLPQTVIINSGVTTTLNITIDTGIR